MGYSKAIDVSRIENEYLKKRIENNQNPSRFSKITGKAQIIRNNP